MMRILSVYSTICRTHSCETSRKAVRCLALGVSWSGPLLYHKHYSRHSLQITGDHRQLELLVHRMDPSVHRLSNLSYCFTPTEMLFNACPDRLTCRIPFVSRCSAVNRAASPSRLVARDVRRDVAEAAICHEIPCIVSLVRAKCFYMAARYAVEQSQRVGPFARTICMTDDRAGNPP